MRPGDAMNSQLAYDLVIVGSGAGGAPIAYEAAARGLSVVVFEKYHFPEIFSR